MSGRQIHVFLVKNNNFCGYTVNTFLVTLKIELTQHQFRKIIIKLIKSVIFGFYWPKYTDFGRLIAIVTNSFC